MQRRATSPPRADFTPRTELRSSPGDTHRLMTDDCGGTEGCGERRWHGKLVLVLVLVLVRASGRRSASAMAPCIPGEDSSRETLAIVGRSAPQRERYRTVAKVPSFVGRFRGTLQRSLARPGGIFVDDDGGGCVRRRARARVRARGGKEKRRERTSTGGAATGYLAAYIRSGAPSLPSPPPPPLSLALSLFRVRSLAALPRLPAPRGAPLDVKGRTCSRANRIGTRLIIESLRRRRRARTRGRAPIICRPR